MIVSSDSFRPYDWIPARHAFGMHDLTTHFRFADNISPHLAWDAVPDAAKSFVVRCFDSDVPAVGIDVNQPDRELPIDLARTVFWHWLLIDIPAHLRALPEGAGGQGIHARGKAPDLCAIGKTGANDYTQWFASNPDMSGIYTGYDGPAPPFNDLRVHAYHFEVLALDIPHLKLDAGFSPAQLQHALIGHVLDRAALVGLYAISPKARAQHRESLE